jgi:hypothetical protein
MHANPSSLDTPSLAACLRQSAGEERDRQADFLRYLDPFDARGLARGRPRLPVAVLPARALAP